MEHRAPYRLTPESGAAPSWIAALAVVCIAIILYGVFYSTNTSTNLAYLLGFSLSPALVLTLLLRVTCLRGHGIQPVLVSFCAIVASLMLCFSIAAQQQRAEVLTAVSSMQAEALRALSAEPGERSGSASQPYARGPFGELERFMLELMADLAAQQDAYVADLTAIGWDDVLDPNRLRTDKGLVRTRAILAQARQLVDKHEALHRQLIEATGARIERARVPADIRRAMVAGFRHGMAASEPVIDEQWQLERQILDEVEALTALFGDPRTWEVSGEMVRFDRDEDVEEYNARLLRFFALIERQESNAQQSMAEFNSSADELREMARR